jgi:hypothetical protein
MNERRSIHFSSKMSALEADDLDPVFDPLLFPAPTA